MFYKKKDRFSIRKFKIGVGSVFLGSFLVAGPQVFADTGETVESVPESSLASPELETVEEVPVEEETSTTTAVVAEEVSVAEEITQVEESSQAPTDKKALESEVAKFAHLESEERYLYATTKEQYDQALQAAKTVLANDAASQEEVDQAVRVLQVAEESLNGVKPAEEETTPEEKVVVEAEKVEGQVELVVTEATQPAEEASRSAEQPAEKTEVTFPTDKLTLEAFKQLSAAEVKALTEEHFRQLNLSDEDVAGLSFELAKALSSSRTYQRYNRSRGEMPEGTGFRTDSAADKFNPLINSKVPDMAQGSTLPTDSDTLRDLFISNHNELPAGTTFEWVTPPSTVDVVVNVVGTLKIKFADNSSKELSVKINVKDQTPPAEPKITLKPDGSVIIVPSDFDDSSEIDITVGDKAYKLRKSQKNDGWIDTVTNSRYNLSGPIALYREIVHILPIESPSGKALVIKAKTYDAAGNASTENVVTLNPIVPNPKTPNVVTLNDQITKVKNDIDKAVADKNKEIEAIPHLTADEITAAKKKIEQAANDAKKALDQEKTTYRRGRMTGDYEQLGLKTQKGLNDIAAVQALAKTKANGDINTAATAKIAAINATPNVSEEAKQVAITKVNDAVEKAKAAINEAGTPTGLIKVVEAGTAAIEAVEVAGQKTPLEITKEEAKQDLQNAADEKIKAITANTDLSPLEQADAINRVNKAVEDGKKAIDAAQNGDIATNASTDAKAAFENLGNVGKDNVRTAIDTAAASKKAAIDANPALTTEEKDAAKKEVDTAVEAAKKEIDSGNTQDVVNTVKDNGVNAINSVNPTPVKKAEAKEKVAEVKREKEQVIDNNTDLTAEEKQAAKEKVAAEADKANKAIDAVASNQGVTDAQTAGETAVREVPETAVKKAEAKAAIDKAAADRKLELALRTDLSPDEKAAVLADVEAAATAEKAKVDQSTNNAGIEVAKTAGETAVNAVDKVGKDQAKAAIDDAQKAKDKEIDDNKNLTAEEKEAAKEQTKQKADEAKQAIDNAADQTGVEEAKTAGEAAVVGVAPTADKKNEANKAIEAKATEAKNAIDQNQDLSQAEKDAKKAEVDAEANKAKAAIDAATSNAEVDTAKTDGENAVNDIQLVGKDNALKAIEDAAAEKEKAINDNAELTAEEKAKAKEAVAQAAKDEKQKVNDATTQEAVNAAQEAGVKAVNDVEVTPAKKKDAKAAIDEKLKEKENLINTATGLTEDEKTAAKEEANKLADEAKKQIDAETTDAAVDKAKTDGTGEIEKVNPNAVTKPEATKAIDEAKAAKDQEIDGNKELTDEEKQAAKEKVQQAAEEAKKAIEKATTNDAVTDAKTKGLNALNNVPQTPEIKNTAKGTIDTAKEQQEQAVDMNPDLTAEEKAAAKAELASKAQEAKDAIDAATTNDAVGDVMNETLPFFNNYDPKPVQKEAAKAKVDEVAKAKEAAIDNNMQATDEEKTAAKQKVQEEANKAKEAIDAATTNADVIAKKDEGIAAINGVDVAPQAKEAAKAAIDRAAEAKKAELIENPDLSTEEKLTAIQKVDEAAKAAKAAIDEASTALTVADEKNKGVEKINADPIAKDKPKVEIEQAAADKIAAINADDRATQAEKAAAIQEVNAAKDKALQAIEDADAADKVTEAVTNGQNEIKAVEVSHATADALEKAKTAAE
ncbi:DUF1542 domain-containing protein, partial [Aerococcaceae bacterium zg-ZUI334]|uniref:DUF1542 domain-containing protein n=1 Tax=Aerococcaceae bacterium zg-252 TaxID=2796928 RepID=UPI001B9EBB41|nr:DUF1542 domain-containing protein [Aerococcaceae bacterium zg-ZUI334]